MNVCLAPNQVLCNPFLGGHAWVYLNWTLGLQANGCHVTWLERFNPNTSAEEALLLLRGLKDRFEAVGMDVPIALCFYAGQRQEYADVADELAELTVELDDVVDGSELLLNFHYSLEPAIISRFKQTALVDIDPGMLQWWIAQRQLRIAAHDVYVTTGETVGNTGGKIPDCGLQWRHFPPVVHLPAWPVTPYDSTAGYGTVSNWWGEWETIDGDLFSNEKRTSFLPYLNLPASISVPLELVLWLDGSDPDLAELRAHGWRVLNPRQECGTPERYRRYIQSARGEFSCAKLSYLQLSNAWVSDRTLCYLASGKPVVVQHTGPSRLLPNGEGMFRFRNPAEAAAAITAVDADYERHAQAARALAEEHFAAEKVVGRLLAEIG